MFDTRFHVDKVYSISFNHKISDHFLQWSVTPLTVRFDLSYLQQSRASFPEIVFRRKLFIKIDPVFGNRVRIIVPSKRRWIVDRAGNDINATEKFDERFWLSLHAQTEQQAYESFGIGSVTIQNHDLISFSLQNSRHQGNHGALAAATLSADQYSFPTQWFIRLPGMDHLSYFPLSVIRAIVLH